MNQDAHPFVVTLNTRFGGRLGKGAHKPNHHACVLEVANVARSNPWSDSAIMAGLPPLDELNDVLSAYSRTRALVPLVVALWDWDHWTRNRREAWANRVSARLGLSRWTDTHMLMYDICEEFGHDQAALRNACAVMTEEANKVNKRPRRAKAD